ncbi:MAG TPA: UDP-N-acetylmuramoyl-tripeptide--D-alanyl-D-alanine ligase [Candidatus Limnocylindrales bacterium]
MTDLLSSTDVAQLVVVTLVTLAALARTIPQLVASVHVLQQDDYSNRRFARWLATSKTRPIFWGLALNYLLWVAFVLLSALIFFSGPVVRLGAPLAATVWVATIRAPKHAQDKKPLVYTGRVKRILAASLVLSAVFFVAGFLVISKIAEISDLIAPQGASLAVLVMAAAALLVAPFMAMLANLVLWPLQATINWSYRFRAGRKLRRFGPMVVGITGSYGKTSTKYFAEALMESRYRVLKTRASFNTILGICRAVNEELGPEHQAFIVEMGAYRRGEIRDMARLTRPHIGVLTAIGPQHLERFGSIETIEKAKFELLQALPADGIAVINSDDPRVRRLAGVLRRPTIWRYGVDLSAGDLDLAAEAITHGPDGLTFTLVERDGKRTDVKTRLIGLHNVSNILAAASVARAADVSMREIAAAIGRLQPVPHRLEVHTGADGVTIIDDAYNSNPVGAAGALAALAEFKTGRKILVTPGMVELGVEQDARNREFGAAAAKVCDYIILVGRNQTAAIRRGALKAGFAEGRAISVKNLDDGLEAMRGIVRAGDIVLLENDLPDLYDEE